MSLPKMRTAAVVFLLSIITTDIHALEVGLRFVDLATDNLKKETTRVALFYPTQKPATTIVMGPFSPTVAINAPPEKSFKGLIVLSHGLGGSELGHVTIAQTLAKAGYLVAALRHPRDNYRDRSLLNESGIGYFVARPKQVTYVLDALLIDPEWSTRIARDSKGYLIGAVGHSAGGYTVLALAGGRPALTPLMGHCQKHRADDPIFCGVRRAQSSDASAASSEPSVDLRDMRIRAVAALAPTGAIFDPKSLEDIRLPVAMYIAGGDRFLVPRFHSEYIAKHIRSAKVIRDSEALHFSYMDKPNMPIQTEDGDIGTDPAGFDRTRFLGKIGAELIMFFEKSLTQ